MPNSVQELPKKALQFQPQLSGLRFCAVFFVVIYHFSFVLTGFKWHYDLGAFIVFFFVLSSYLVTRILLDAKVNAAESGMSRWKVGIAFLVRRTLRIFPAYYLYLFILMAFVAAGLEVRQHPAVFFSYLYNYWIFIQGSWGPYTVHLWSLAIEEQFYLVWPWIILFVPNRHLPKVFLFMILGGIVFRVVMLTIDPFVPQFPMLVLTPSCMDSFAAGALLAYYHSRGKINNQWLKICVLIALPIWFGLILTNHHRSFIGVDRFFISLFAVAVIDKGNRGFKGVFQKLMVNRVVQYLSTISYGIYLYHLIVPFFFWKVFAAIDRTIIRNGYSLSFVEKMMASPYVSFLIYFLMAVGCATISWYCLEKPFNSLKRLFSYSLPKKKIVQQ